MFQTLSSNIITYRARYLSVGLAFLGLVAVLLASKLYFFQYESQKIQQTANQRLTIYQESLRRQIEQFRAVPSLLADDPRIITAMTDRPADQTVSSWLDQLSSQLGTDELFVLDPTGETLWSSNYLSNNSFVGQNYGFRPYFRTAMAGNAGFYFAVGATTGKPGLFFSNPIRSGESVLGVMVAKVSLEPLATNWRESGDRVWLSNDMNFVFLSSRESDLYLPLDTVNDAILTELETTRQIGNAVLQPTPTHIERYGVEFISLHQQDAVQPSQSFLRYETKLSQYDWTLHWLLPASELENKVLADQLYCVIIFLFITAVMFWGSERRKRHRIQMQATEELEHRVAQRTEELKAAERALSHNERLASLGRMSAAIAHEVNQPVTAIANYAASTKLLIERDKVDVAKQNIGKISDLTERLRYISKQLRMVSGKRNTGMSSVPLKSVFEYALDVLDDRISHENIQFTVKSPNHISVNSNRMMLEQVIVNLLRNAMDAMQKNETRAIVVKVQQAGEHCYIDISDNGPGLNETDLPYVFEPFYSTKTEQDSLGLGLAISYNLVSDMGGALSVLKTNANGTTFRIQLDAATDAITLSETVT